MGNANWETPPEFFKVCSDVWGPFEVDAAADKANTKCHAFLGDDFDSVKNDWPFKGRRVWLNPPFKNVGGWVHRVINEACHRNNFTCSLLPIPRGDGWITTLRIWAELIEVDGRIRFIDPGKNGRVSPVGGNILAIMRPPKIGVRWPIGYSGMRLNWGPINGAA